ncbi:hypothetical protein KDA11_06055, partial [Candidatus Saccharibacteria bacterium]|nr:hypothetical protein [Candidatus Saccharibacteria bacterium]
MAKGKPTDSLLRAEIVGKIRDEGMSVAVASATYGFSSKTIYTWLLDSANTEAERWLELAKETFNSVTNVGDVFEMANDEERRRLMMYIGSNWHLGNKKVALTPREPLSLLHRNNSETIWRA